jgi:hypothetical protein
MTATLTPPTTTTRRATRAARGPYAAGDFCRNLTVTGGRGSGRRAGQTVRTWLGGFRGDLLADASSIDDVIYRQGAMVEVGCWAHLRRYFWRALPSAPERATEAIARIGRLFEIERECASLALAERTNVRARRARPVLKRLDDRGVAAPRRGRSAESAGTRR